MEMDHSKYRTIDLIGNEIERENGEQKNQVDGAQAPST